MLDSGVHLRLAPVDFAKWATLIVSRLLCELRNRFTKKKSTQQFGEATVDECPDRIIQAAQKREDERKEQSGTEKAPTPPTRGSESGARALPPNLTAPNPTSFPTASTTILPAAWQLGQFIPNPAVPQQYGTPASLQAFPTAINPFYGYGPPAFQAGYDFRPSVFPQVPSYYPFPAPVTYAPYMHFPGQYYGYLPQYWNIQPPVYPPYYCQPTAVPHTTLPPTFGTNCNVPDPARRRRSPSPEAKIEDLSEYPDLSD